MQSIEDIRLVEINSQEMYAKFKGLIKENTDYLTEEYILIGAFDSKDSVPAGIIICSDEGSDLIIDYFFVEESYRRSGIGTLLFEEIKELTLYNSKMEGLIAEFDNDNEELFAFFYIRPDVELNEKVAYDSEGRGITASCNYLY